VLVLVDEPFALQKLFEIFDEAIEVPPAVPAFVPEFVDPPPPPPPARAMNCAKEL
jgi:hypothetical protein